MEVLLGNHGGGVGPLGIAFALAPLIVVIYLRQRNKRRGGG